MFDGISCARVALERAGIPVEAYYAAEVDEYAIQTSKKNYPQIIRLGDVSKIHCSNGCFCARNGDEVFIEEPIDLLIGGSPCQDLSIARGAAGRDGLKGERSGLFYEYARILKEVQPRWFILENVASMSDESKNAITEVMGVEPIMIDATLVSAQQRRRLFWTNIGVDLPVDRGIVVNDILDDVERKWVEPKNVIKTARGVRWDTSGKGYSSQQDRAYSVMGKFPTIPTARTITKVNALFTDGKIGVLNWNEIERLQSLPDGYTDLGSENRIEKRGGVIGNGFNVEVIAHILRSAHN